MYQPQPIPEQYYTPAEKPKIPIGYVLYALALPVIGLFLERYAVSAIVAIIMWVLVLILMPISCALDKKMLVKYDVNTEALGKTYLSPPLNIKKRQLIDRGEKMLCVASVTLIIGALLTNGFIKGMRVNSETVEQMIPNTAVTQLSNFSGSSINTIGECLEAYSSEELKWTTTKESYGFESVAAGKHDDKEFKVTFKLEFDGFAYHDFIITDVEIDGKQLEKDERKDFYQACFIDYKKSVSSSQTDSSSKTDSSNSK